jgi:hypothetical protein
MRTSRVSRQLNTSCCSQGLLLACHCLVLLQQPCEHGDGGTDYVVQLHDSGDHTHSGGAQAAMLASHAPWDNALQQVPYARF